MTLVVLYFGHWCWFRYQAMLLTQMSLCVDAWLRDILLKESRPQNPTNLYLCARNSTAIMTKFGRHMCG